jgi:hypothetical protein
MFKIIITTFFLSLLTLCGCNNNNATSPIDEPNNSSEMPIDVREMLEKYTYSEDERSMDDINLVYSPTPAFLMDTSYDVYAVTFLWGHLFNASTESPNTTDWSGSLWVNGVSIVNTVHTISFEEGQDYLIEDSLEYSESWISYTGWDFDGISFLVFMKRGIIYVIEPTLHFETTPMNLEFSFDQLVNLFAFYLIDNQNAVAVHARKLWPHGCSRGYITGEWVKNDIGGDNGHFMGVWFDINHQPTELLSGNFWTEEDGGKLFHGSVSGYVTDEVIAEVWGTWAYDDPRLCPLCGSGHGYYIGVFKYINGDGDGLLKGVFGDYSQDITALSLPMTGIWQERCIYTDIEPLPFLE